MKKLLKPKKLEIGDTVSVIAPSSPFDRNIFKSGIKILKTFGLKVHYRKDIFAKDYYLAGTDSRRLKELHDAFTNTRIRGIFCARGGFGLTRILDKIDFKSLRRNPKILVGFSDVTALELAIYNAAGFTTLHGPMIASKGFTGLNKDRIKTFKSTIFSNRNLVYKKQVGVRTLRSGTAKGRLLGGNLSIIHSLCGTKHLPSFRGKILFLEDIGEPQYKLDRILCHLFQLKLFNGIKGLVLGRFTDSKRRYAPIEQRKTEKIFFEYFKKLRVPIIANFPVGHGKDNVILPMGSMSVLNATNKELICEAFLK